MAKKQVVVKLPTLSDDDVTGFKAAYNSHVAERAAQSIPPLPLSAKQAMAVVELLKNPPPGDEDFLIDLLKNRVPPGVDDASYVKANFLRDIVSETVKSPLVSRGEAIDLLGTMQGGYNVQPLVEALDLPDAALADRAVKALSGLTMLFDTFNDVADKMKAGSATAKKVIESWAHGEWFTSRPKLPEKVTLTVFKVTGETNTDDLSPAPDAWSRPDIPLHGLAMLKNPRDGIHDCQAQLTELKKKGFPLVYVGDVVGTGSSRKSATNSILWYMGDDIPCAPNKRAGGFVLGGVIAPIFFNTMEDSGALPIELDVSKMSMGDVIDLYVYDGVVKRHDSGDELCKLQLKTDVLLDEVRAGGRIPLIIGRGITGKAREALGLPPTDLFKQMAAPARTKKGWSLWAEAGWQSLRR
jgi:aconitate hydratase 2/2-methylisocitrate dehydratase